MLRFFFVSAKELKERGFKFFKLLVSILFFPVCPTMAQLSGKSGVITSPFYPRRYPNNQNCRWQITSNNGSHIKLDIANTMDVFQCNQDCTVCDYLEIQYGYSNDGAASGKKCGRPNKVLTYYSTGDTLKLNFFADGANDFQSMGFKATYTQLNFTPPGKCFFLGRGGDNSVGAW